MKKILLAILTIVTFPVSSAQFGVGFSNGSIDKGGVSLIYLEYVSLAYLSQLSYVHNYNNPSKIANSAWGIFALRNPLIANVSFDLGANIGSYTPQMKKNYGGVLTGIDLTLSQNLFVNLYFMPLNYRNYTDKKLYTGGSIGFAYLF